MAIENNIKNIIRKQKSGIPDGITSVCSSNPFVLKATIKNAKEKNKVLLIESTSNQVDQFGGYTGMTPYDFKKFVDKLADEVDFPPEKIILGGDHLGPNVWQNENSDSALKKAKDQLRAYVKAGYKKIHLDASMKLADDGDRNEPLESPIIAERSADLCRAAEEAFKELNDEKPPYYIIGTDVPPPGGAKTEHNKIRITLPEEVDETIELTHKAFEKRNLSDVWERVVAVVVQPGVEFTDWEIFDYERQPSMSLVEKIKEKDNLIFEAHSTDYQREAALRQMVEDQFGILKVGPELTFAFREAVFALIAIEEEVIHLHNGFEKSNLKNVLLDEMSENPNFWNKYYAGNPQEISFAQKYSLSDRIRYYWSNEKVNKSLEILIRNLSQNEIPLSLISQYLPEEYDAFRKGLITKNPQSLIINKINKVLNKYHSATKGEF